MLCCCAERDARRAESADAVSGCRSCNARATSSSSKGERASSSGAQMSDIAAFTGVEEQRASRDLVADAVL